jgi:hypothetical protein
MNYVGIALAVISTIPYVFVKTDIEPPNASTDNAHPNNLGVEEIEAGAQVVSRKKIWFRRIFDYGSAAFTVLMFGEAYTPVIYMGQAEKNPDLITYLLSYYNGLLIGSIIFFIVYCLVTKNKPILYPNLVLAGIASGLKLTL